MNHPINRILLIIFILALLAGCHGPATDSPVYDAKVRIEPRDQYIEAEVRIVHPPDTCFYLNGDLEITDILADGKKIAFRRDRSQYMPYSAGTAVMTGHAGKEMTIRYRGALKHVINGVNRVDSNLVELALYSAWMPMFRGNRLFEFSLEADLPQEYMTVTNGRLANRRVTGNRCNTSWKSLKSGFDLVLLASPAFVQENSETPGLRIEMTFSRMPRETMIAKMERLAEGMKQLSTVYGAPRLKGLLRFVYSPRGGWGYSRMPLFVVSESYAMELLKQESGRAGDFHGAAHEMAHFWWMIADPDTPYDWINEALAEYSAYRLSEKYDGKAYADLLVDEYREHAARSRQQVSIAETRSDSDDRYVNRYEKTTLMLIEARRRFGEERLDQALHALHRRFAGTLNATTEDFLAEAENRMGPEARSFFSLVLFQKDWTDPAQIPE
ncbi:hypothetical protein JW948_07375 [bacterium]|nr:hypothetical protein [bacterium]